MAKPPRIEVKIALFPPADCCYYAKCWSAAGFFVNFPTLERYSC